MSITKITRRESYEAIKPKVITRQAAILNILGDRNMTAYEIAKELFRRGITPTIERNYAAPRLTELEKRAREGL